MGTDSTTSLVGVNPAEDLYTVPGYIHCYVIMFLKLLFHKGV